MKSNSTSSKLEKELTQRNAELSLIRSVQDGIVNQMELDQIYEMIGDKIRDLFDAQVVGIYTIDIEQNMEHFEYLFEDGERLTPEPRNLDKVRQKMVKTKKLIHIDENFPEEVGKITGTAPKAVPGTKLPKSLLFVPMVVREVVKGYVSLQNLDKEKAFSKNDVQMLNSLTKSLSVALENARLFNESEQHNAELAVINSVQQGLVAEMDMQGIYDLVGNRIRELFNAQFVAICTFNHDSSTEEFHYVYEDGEVFKLEPRPIDKVRQLIIDTGELLCINENADEVWSNITGEEPTVIPGTKLTKSALFVPLKVGSEVKGYVSLQNIDIENAFSDSDIRLLSTLSNSMSVALENARLFNETEQRNAELAVINSVQQGLVAEMDLQGIYDLVGNKIRELFDAQVVSICTFNYDNKTEEFHYIYEDGELFKLDPRPIDKVRQLIIDTGDLLCINENADDVWTEITGEEPTVVPGTKLTKSALFVPLKVGEEVRGYVSLQNLDKEHAFSDADIRLLSTLSNSMSVALENARLFNETEQRNAELAVINSVQQGLVAEMDMQGIYDLVGNKIRDLFDAQVTGIYSFNHETGLEHFHYLFEDGELLTPEPRPLNKIRKWLIKNRELLLVNENFKETMAKITGEKTKAVPGTRLPKSTLFVPLLVGSEVKGCVSLQNLDRENAFSPADVRLLSTLSNSMSVALENARLFNETEQRNAELAVINSVQQGLVAEMDMQGIYDLVGDKIRDLFDAQVTGIYSFDTDSNLEHFHYLHEDGERLYPAPRKLNKLRKWLIKNKELILSNSNTMEAMQKITGDKSDVVPGTRYPKSVLFVPLMVGSEVKGCVSLQNLDREHAFSDGDVRLLRTLSNSMSVALENARLFNETEQRNAELAVINSVQQGLVAEMDMQGIYKLVGDKIRNLFDSQVTSIATFDYTNKLEHFGYFYENGELLSPEPRPFNEIRTWLIKNKKLLLCNENTAETLLKLTGSKTKALPGTEYPKSVLFVPLLVGQEVKGVVSLQNIDNEHAFSEADVRLLSTLANSMSVALENARLFNETEQRNAELAVITSVQQGLVAEMDMQGIYELVGNKIRDLFNSQVTSIATFNHKTKTEHFRYFFENGKRIEPESRKYDKIRESIIKKRKTLLINENVLEKLSEIAGKQMKPVKGTAISKSFIAVPMIVGNTVPGYITLQNIDREHAFSESDVRLLETLVNSMSVALENARLFNETTRLLAETEKRNAELAVINSVQEGLVREMDMQAIYSLVGDRLCEVADTQTLIIRTFDHKNGLETWEYAIENDERLYVDPKPFIWANKLLIKTKETMVINEDYVKTAIEYGDTNKGVSKGLPPKSAIFVPMLLGGTVIGSISLQNVERENAFSESDVSLLTTLTNSMSVALENARLFKETEQRATEMQTVNNISKALVSQLEFDSLMKLVGEQMRDTFNADIVYLAIHDRKSDMLHFPYHYGDKADSRKFGNGITEKIILSKKPLLINQNMDEAYNKIKAERKGKMVESYLGVPIFSGNNAIGVVSVQSTEQRNRFGENDMRLLSTIAANLGVAMQNAEAYRKLQAALDELKSAQQLLIQSEKMASLGELTAGIAHEIQNPLNFVNNFSEVSKELLEELLEEIKNGDTKEADDLAKDIQDNLEKIMHHGKRADGIVKGMLLHSRTNSGEKENVDLNIIVDEYLRLAYHGLRAKDKSFNAKFETNYDAELPKTKVIPQEIGRVVLNLITNAFHACTERNKNISKDHKLNKNGSSYDPTVWVQTISNGKNIAIKVKDNGNGIPDHVKEKIFQPFFTTKPTGQGTGLGLSLSYDIIKAHGGQLYVETKKGEGSEFTIELPI